MKYYITQNKLNNNGKFTARVITSKNYTEDELIDKILSKRNIISRPDLEGVVAALKETVVEIVSEGNGLNLPWLKLGYGMKGNFNDEDDVRNLEVHPLEISLNAGKILNEVLPGVEMERITQPNFNPRILHFKDGVSETTDSQLTPGGVFNIIGKRMRIGGPQSSGVGLYLRTEDGTETKVDVLLRNDPKHLVGQAPQAIEAGDYQVVVKTQLGSSGNMIREVRTGISDFYLKVA